MTPNDNWPSVRLDDLQRQTEGLLASYGALMQAVARLDERADVADRERQEMREVVAVAAKEFRQGLAEFDRSCTAKVDEVGRKVEATARATRQEIRDETKDIREEIQQRQWTPMAKAAPYAATIAAIGAFAAALLKP